MTQAQFGSFANIIEIVILVINVVLFLYVWDAFYKLKRLRAVAAAVIISLFFAWVKLIFGLPGRLYSYVLAFSAVVYGFAAHRDNRPKSVLAMVCFLGFKSLSWLISICTEQNAINAVCSGIEDEIGSSLYFDKFYRLTAMIYVGFAASYAVLLWAMIFLFRRVMRETADIRWSDVVFLLKCSPCQGHF